MPQAGASFCSEAKLGGGQGLAAPALRTYVSVVKTKNRWNSVLLLLMVAGCAHSSAPETSAPAVTSRAAPSLKERYAGTYVYAGGEEGKQAVNDAVDASVKGMGIASGFAKSALMERAVIRPSYTIAFDAKGDVEITTPGYPPEISPSNGAEVKMTNKTGDESQTSQHFTKGILLQKGRTKDGEGETEFRLQPDGKTLLVKKVMESSQLPRPVEYTLTYVRQSGVSAK